MLKKILRYVLFGLLGILVIMQFFRIDKTNPPVDASKDFIALEQPPQEVVSLLKAACYDCHSHETAYPWYTNIAPVSWWIKDHIDHGRDELNFSEWGDYSRKRKHHKLEEMAEEVEEGHMPMPSYTWGHAEARLSEDQKETLEDWSKQQMSQHEE